jgi:lysophospholipase L1-like esterase
LLLVVAAGAVLVVGLNLAGGRSIVNAPPREGPIVALGDSLTWGYGAHEPGQLDYVDRLSALLGEPIINRGVPRETIAEAVARIDRDVLPHKPSIVLVCLGGNDLLRRMDLNRSFPVLEEGIRKIQRDGAMVVLIGLKMPVPLGDVGRRYKELAERTGCVFVPDALGGILGQRSRMFDEVHPNEEGYKLLADKVHKAVKEYVD